MGYEKEIITPGNGAMPAPGQLVTVECTGIVQASNKKFWSTKDPGQKPFSFNIGQRKVIRGWDEGVATMKVGETARLTMTHDYAYGENGFPAWGIPPKATLIFEITLLSVK